MEKQNRTLNKRLNQIGHRQKLVNNFKDQVATEFCPYKVGQKIKYRVFKVKEMVFPVYVTGTIQEIRWNKFHTQNSIVPETWCLKIQVESATTLKIKRKYKKIDYYENGTLYDNAYKMI